MKPEVKFAEGKLFITLVAGYDADNDNLDSVSATVVVSIDAVEAVNEIIKKEVPEWLKKIVAEKA